MKWLFLFFALPGFAVYVGNPADPAIMNTGFFSSSYPFFKCTSGYIYDYTSNKRYEADTQIDPIRKFGLHSQLASVSLILLERVQLFGSAGGSKEMVHEGPPPSFSDLVFDFQSSYQFAWSTGGKAILVELGTLYLSADFTYFAVPSSPKTYFKFLNRLNLPLSEEKQKLSLREWQASLGLSLRLFFLTPYAGTSYLHSRLHIQQGPDTPAILYHNAVNWGFFYGITASLTGRLHVNFERRVRDEFAYTISTIAVF